MSIRALGVAVVVLAACVVPDDVGVAESEITITDPAGAGRLLGNRLLGNRLLGNRLLGNRLLGNRLLGNGALAPGGQVNQSLVSGTATEDAIIDDQDTRDYLSYLIGCALEPWQSVTFASSSGNVTMYGEAGLAPEWLDQALSLSGQEKVSACLLARVNNVGEVRPLWVTFRYEQISSQVAADFSIKEGGYFGNVFIPEMPMYRCNYDPSNRDCDNEQGQCDGDTSPITWVGLCGPGATWPNNNPGTVARACAGSTYGNYYGCTNGDLSDNLPAPTRTFTWVATVRIDISSKENVGAEDGCGGLTDYAVDNGIPSDASPACSMCVYTVTRLGGTSHRTGATISARPSCETNWDSTCVRNARDLCGTHSVCETGTALYRGDSACINKVCDADAFCCTSSWDELCVQKATSVCRDHLADTGLDCTPYATRIGMNGQSSYCAGDGSCVDGQGDCDAHTDCRPGTACIADVGPEYQMAAGIDVCVACHVGAPGALTYCSPGCPCQAGEGDCDTDADCVSGTKCVHNVGLRYPFALSHTEQQVVDVCERSCHTGSNGDLSFCTAACPCLEGEGDCDSDDECGMGLYCSGDGSGPNTDYCARRGT